MSKIEHDKYYTPVDLAKYCIDKTFEIIGKENITEIIEPSAGNGSFSNQLDCIAYDLYPEGDNIIQQDYLTLDKSYKKGRLIIGNPPFGDRNTMSVKFYKKSIKLGDYIAFILPISQLNNNQQMYEFDLIHSEDLGKRYYENIDLNCCFNIYKRNIYGKLNKKPSYKLKDVIIKENRRGGQKINDFNYDIGICSFGSGIIGKIPNYVGQYSKEFYFKVYNNKLKGKIINLIKDTDWENDVCKHISGQCNLAQWQVYKYIKEQIPEIE